MRPGVDVTSLAQAPPRSAPTDTGTAFMVAATEKGPTGNVGLVRSLAEYESVFGIRTGFEAGYDAAEAYFREGGVRLYVSKMTGPTTLAQALAALNSTYGPGQVFDTTSPTVAGTRTSLLAHAKASNRVALLEAPAGTAQSLVTIGEVLQSDVNARYGALFGPPATVPGIASGTTRTVGMPPIVAGMLARNDPKLTPNVPAAGAQGRSAFAISLANAYTDQEYSDLNLAGVDVARVIYGQIEMYGWRSCVDPDTAEKVWLDFGHSRLNMAITARAEEIGEQFVFAQIDGRGKKIAQFGSELRAMLVPFYEAGALYGEDADDAFRVNVGNQVNTPETIAAGELHAVIEARMSPFAEYVVIQIVKVATTAAIAA